jgi:hypothetical protein
METLAEVVNELRAINRHTEAVYAELQTLNAQLKQVICAQKMQAALAKVRANARYAYNPSVGQPAGDPHVERQGVSADLSIP